MTTAEAVPIQTPAPTEARVGRLLLVDDDEGILRALRRALRRGNWEIELATDGVAGLETFDRLKPEVVISDFRMPGMNGVEFLTKVKERAPRTQRIMLTGHADQHAIEEAINRSEVFRFMTKPWNDAQLVLTVKSAFEQHQLVAENERLMMMTAAQNLELRQLNADLEQRVEQRTTLLTLAKREWEVTFDTIDSPILVVAPDLTVRRANRASLKLAGAPILEGGTACYRLLFGRSEPCANCPMVGKAPSADIKAGEHTYVVTAYPMAGDGGGVVLSYRDVSQEREMTKRLIDSEKMVALGNLAGAVAHEINNPLGGILAFSQLMKRDAGRSPPDLESLTLIEESALRCKRIVESLLKFSRRSRDRSRLNWTQCIEDALFLFRAQMKKFPECQLETAMALGLPPVMGDSSQLGQVVLNLLQNALHALVDGVGRIRVETSARDGACQVSVSDNGVGISPENLPRIFEPHFTTKPPGVGTGLGLSIAYRIVADHGGRFEVESKVGQGTTVTVVIPACSEGEA